MREPVPLIVVLALGNCSTGSDSGDAADHARPTSPAQPGQAPPGLRLFHESLIPAATPTAMAVEVNGAALSSMLGTANGKHLQLLLRPAPGEPVVTVDVERYDIYTAGSRTEIMTASGTEPATRPPLAMFRGTVAGDGDSRIAITVGNNFAMGTLVHQGRRFRFGPVSAPGTGARLRTIAVSKRYCRQHCRPADPTSRGHISSDSEGVVVSHRCGRSRRRV